MSLAFLCLGVEMHDAVYRAILRRLVAFLETFLSIFVSQSRQESYHADTGQRQWVRVPLEALVYVCVCVGV
jgi:hypothetical protein